VNTMGKLVKRGFTLIELMVVIAVVAVIAALAAPMFTSLIEMQRLRGTTAQLVTDLQFARNEAVSRNTLVRLSFNANPQMTCYTLYTSTELINAVRCNCLLGAGNACTAANVEIRTVQMPTSRGVQVLIPIPQEYDTAFAFDNITGGLYAIPTDFLTRPLDSIRIDSFLDAPRKLSVAINRTGRPAICSPEGSTMSETACPPP